MNYQDCPKCGNGLIKQITENGYIAYSCYMCGYVEYDPPGEDLPYIGKCKYCGEITKGIYKKKYCDKHTSNRDRKPKRKGMSNKNNNNNITYVGKEHPWKNSKYNKYIKKGILP
jgi:hypothetical protein